ncbi:MAG: hypothetical protein K9H84_02715 [Bacteroidales bacterium]|nr:hypothetical protein [Bacteroidales bacterium]
MRFTVFKRPNPKQFEYKPLYYDERKEELEKVKEQYSDPEKAQQIEEIRDRIERRWEIHRNHKGEGKSSNITLLLYLLLIGAVVYVLFFSELF